MKSAGSFKSVNVLPSPASQPKLTGANRQEQEGLSKQDVVQPRLRIVSNPYDQPIPTLQSKVVPGKDLSQPADRYAGGGRKVNSKAEAKGDYRPSNNSPKSAPPQFVGSTFAHLPNAANRPLLPAPKLVTVPRPVPVLTGDQFSGAPMLSNRSPNGSILGSSSKRYVPEDNVPYMPPDEPVGPDNPVKAINETWSACWDKEAGAIYYYNQITGEATWLPPEL